MKPVTFCYGKYNLKHASVHKVWVTGISYFSTAIIIIFIISFYYILFK